jgi:predicted RNase H-like HicB family nuclease
MMMEGTVMGMYVYEFEFFESEGYVAAFPFDLEDHATQGKDFADAVDMAADLLRVVVEDSLLHGRDMPEPAYGHEPEQGGKVVVIGVSVSLDEIRAVKVSEAAERLGVSRGRISNMVKAGILEGFRKGRDSFVTLDSLEARMREPRGAGRPKKALV